MEPTKRVKPSTDPVYRRGETPKVHPLPDCQCATWARDGPVFWIGHHPSCVHYNADEIARGLIEPLLDGIEKWAAHEDGVCSDVWEAYKNACVAMGQEWRFSNQEPV